MKTEKELIDSILKCPAPGSVYRHYKGGLYEVHSAAIDEATGELVVIYGPYRGEGLLRFARPLSQWKEEILMGTDSGGTFYKKRRYAKDNDLSMTD